MAWSLSLLLGYLDQTLDSADMQAVETLVAKDAACARLIHRLGDVMRRIRLRSPDANDQRLTPSSVAEYLDHAMSPGNISDFEELCLGSDEYLAELAACHQILAIVLGEPASVPSGLRHQAYAIAGTRDPLPHPSEHASWSQHDENVNVVSGQGVATSTASAVGNSDSSRDEPPVQSSVPQEAEPDECLESSLDGSDERQVHRHDAHVGVSARPHAKPKPAVEPRPKVSSDRGSSVFLGALLTVIVVAWTIMVVAPSSPEGEAKRSGAVEESQQPLSDQVIAGGHESQDASPQPAADSVVSEQSPELVSLEESPGAPVETPQASVSDVFSPPPFGNGFDERDAAQSDTQSVVEEVHTNNEPVSEQLAGNAPAPTDSPSPDREGGSRSPWAVDRPTPEQQRPSAPMPPSWSESEGGMNPDIAARRPSHVSELPEPQFSPLEPKGYGGQEDASSARSGDPEAAETFDGPSLGRWTNVLPAQCIPDRPELLFTRSSEDAEWGRLSGRPTAQPGGYYAVPAGFKPKLRLSNGLVLELIDGVRMRLIGWRDPDTPIISLEEGRLLISVDREATREGPWDRLAREPIWNDDATLADSAAEASVKTRQLVLRFDDHAWRLTPDAPGQTTEELVAHPREGLLSVVGTFSRIEVTATTRIVSTDVSMPRSSGPIRHWETACTMTVDPGVGGEVRWEASSHPAPVRCVGSPHVIEIMPPGVRAGVRTLARLSQDFGEVRGTHLLPDDAAELLQQELIPADRRPGEILAGLSRSHPTEEVQKAATNSLIIMQDFESLGTAGRFVRFPSARTIR